MECTALGEVKARRRVVRDVARAKRHDARGGEVQGMTDNGGGAGVGG
jgi:hypothetical protein